MSATDSVDALQRRDEVLYKFSIYPFSSDSIFQDGVQSIINSARGKSPEELEHIIGRAKVFYFARTTGHTISWEDYVEWKKTHPSPFPIPPEDPPVDESRTGTSAQSPSPDPPPLSFQQITELIRSGQTDLIPYNKVIPDALNVETPSDSTRPVRMKPWELAAAQTEDIATELES